MTHLEVNGLRICVHRWGDKRDVRALILLHSLGEDAATWERVAQELASTHQVLGIDLRGHGDSDRAAEYSLELMRDDVLGVLDHLELTEVCIVGHSLGGMVGYLMAISGDPRVTRLVLEEAPPPLPIVPPRPIPDDPGGEHGFDWKALTDLYRQRNHPDPRWWDALKNLTIPVLVIAGGPASHIDQPQLHDMAERMPNASFVTIDAGHDVHSRKPSEFITAMVDFLGR